MAPRPFMVERGHVDGVAPDEWVAYEYSKVRRFYDTKMKMPDRTDDRILHRPAYHQRPGHVRVPETPPPLIRSSAWTSRPLHPVRRPCAVAAVAAGQVQQTIAPTGRRGDRTGAVCRDAARFSRGSDRAGRSSASSVITSVSDRKAEQNRSLMHNQSSVHMTKLQTLLSADFLDQKGALIFPDISLESIAGSPRIQHRFLDSYLPEYAPEQLRDADVLLSLKPKVTAKSLEGIERLCAIGRFGVGYDNVDLAACTERDIAVYITRQAVIRPVASSIVLFVLAASHNLILKDRLLRRGEWAASARALGLEPRGRVLGTVGLGNIAREALKLLRPFELGRLLAHDPAVTPETAREMGVTLVPLERLFEESDYVLINCPLTPETRGLIGEPLLRRMKKDAVFINTARGPIVDEAALSRMLAEGAIKCAALDVFEQEPLPAESPLRGFDNAILTSHSICWTYELFRDMGREAFAGVLAIASGQAPANVVNTAVLTRPGFLRKLQQAAAR